MGEGENRWLVVGRFWDRDDGMMEGYIDLGIMGRLRCRVLKTNEKREGHNDCDKCLVVHYNDTPLGMARKLVTKIDGALYEDERGGGEDSES